MRPSIRSPEPMVRVSVLLPVRDAAATIGAALKSVLRSTERNLECVVVDDASRDESGRIARAIADRDPRVRVIGGEGRGLVAALEIGRSACRAPWIARMDADDLMHRLRLSEQLAACETNGWDACGSHVRLFPRAILKDGARAYERWIGSLHTPEDLARDRFVECPLVHPTLLVRRECLSYRDTGWPEDYDLVLRLYEERRRIGVVPRRLVSWREGPTRLSRTHAAYTPERFAACKAHFLARGFLVTSTTYLLAGYGPAGKMLRAALAREGRRASHLLDLKPGRIGQVIDGAPVVGPDALATLPPGPMIVCVSGLEPRRVVRGELAASGRVEGRDFVCCA